MKFNKSILNKIFVKIEVEEKDSVDFQAESLSFTIILKQKKFFCLALRATELLVLLSIT